MEREFPGKSVVTAAYVGRRGLHLQREANINQPTPEVVAANPGVNIDALRPYKGYNSIRETDNVASSMYNSFQLSWNSRFSHGFTFGVSYTLSKSMDDGSAQRDIIPNTYNAAQHVGPVGFRRPSHLHRQLLLRAAVLPRRQQAQRQAARRLADQRHHPVPDRHPLRRGSRQRLRRASARTAASIAADSSGSRVATPRSSTRSR